MKEIRLTKEEQLDFALVVEKIHEVDIFDKLADVIDISGFEFDMIGRNMDFFNQSSTTHVEVTSEVETDYWGAIEITQEIALEFKNGVMHSVFVRLTHCRYCIDSEYRIVYD